jgi:hypothetical protein
MSESMTSVSLFLANVNSIRQLAAPTQPVGGTVTTNCY